MDAGDRSNRTNKGQANVLKASNPCQCSLIEGCAWLDGGMRTYERSNGITSG